MSFKQKFLTILFFATAIVASGLVYLYRILPDELIPYPYRFVGPTSLKRMGNDTYVLVVGDRMGINLGRYLPYLTSQIVGANPITPFNIENWSQSKEGLHRSLKKIKAATDLPKIVLYHGGSEEFYEKKFFIKEENKILYNFQHYHDDKVKTALMFMPILSKVLYKRVVRSPIKFSNIIKDDFTYSDTLRQKQISLGLQLFEIELEDFIETVRSKNSRPILTTIPLNYEALPKKICQNSTTTEIIELQNRVFQLMKQGDFKTAYTNLQSLNSLTPGNALTTYLLGKTQMQLGNAKEAISSLNLSSSLDCEVWRGNAVQNAIIRKIAEKYDVPIFDFDQLVNQFYGTNTLFVDEIFPQELFYHKALDVLAVKIKKLMRI